MPLPISNIVNAQGTYTASGAFTDTQTVVIGGKTYTSQTTLTNSDGNFLIGASAAESLQNLYDAINLTPGSIVGVKYATATTRHPQVYAHAVTATTLVVKAKHPGTSGNLITTTETQTNGSWGAGTLASGAGDPAVLIDELISQGQLNSDMFLALKTYFPLKP